jgi:hypothetical protein
MRWAAAICVVAGCGRLGFDAVHQDVTVDATVDSRPDAAPALLPCNQATSASGTVSAMADQLVVAANANEIVAITTDNSDVLRSWTFDVSETGSVVPGAMGNVLASNATGTLAMAPFGTNTLVAWSTPNTQWSQVDPAGQGIGTEGAATQPPAAGALAASGIDGTLALLTVGSNSEVEGIVLDSAGAASGTMVIIIAADVGAQSVRMAPAATGYVVTYTDPRPAVNTREVMLLDAQLAVVAGPVAASTDPYDAEDGEVAWAPASNTYVAAWGDKSTTADEVSYRVFDAQLSPLAATATVIEGHADGVGLRSDGQSFWLVTNGYNPSELLIDAIAADGSTTSAPAIPVTALAADLAIRAGQPVVTWLVQDALWLDGVCTN